VVFLGFLGQSSRFEFIVPVSKFTLFLAQIDKKACLKSWSKMESNTFSRSSRALKLLFCS